MLTGTLTLTLTLTLTMTGTLTLILILSSLIIHDAVASCRHTPQSLHYSSPKLRRAITAYNLKAT